jgi:hypothetical protein
MRSEMDETRRFGDMVAYDLDRFHHRVRPEITREQPDPEESRLLRQLGESCFDVVGGLVFALYHCQHQHQHLMHLINSQSEKHLRPSVAHNTLSPQLLPRRQRMQDQMLE